MHSEGNAGKEKRGAGRGISARNKSLEQNKCIFISWENGGYFLEISEKCFYSWVFFHESDLGMAKTVESAEERQGYCQQVSNDSPNFSYFFVGKNLLPRLNPAPAGVGSRRATASTGSFARRTAGRRSWNAFLVILFA